MTTKEKRTQFFNEIKDFWHDLEGKEYALYDLKEISRKEVSEIREAAEKIYKIYEKTNQLVRNLSDEILEELGYPKEFIPFVRQKTIAPETIISRLDMVRGSDGYYKHYEINADTPTFIKELFDINGKLANHFGYDNPNEKQEEVLQIELTNAILDSYAVIENQTTLPNICFVAHKESKEDWLTTKYLSDICELPNTLVDFENLVINDEGVYTNDGMKIDVLYRQTYPIEYLINDIAEETNENLGVKLLNLALNGKIAIINPISAFIMQNKSIQALIWAMYEDDVTFFTEEEKTAIKKHFIPTYFEQQDIGNVKHVRKPIYGREGDTIEIYDEGTNKIAEDVQKNYTHWNSIYQQYTPLPKEDVFVNGQVERRNMLIGVFLISGKASALGCRVGNEITGNESEFLALGHPKERK